MSEVQLGEKVAIVTGASEGIGAALSRRLNAQGVRVVLVARRVEPLEALVKTLNAEVPHLIFRADVSDDERMQALVEATLNAFGRIDILVNNAGLHHRGRFDANQTFDLAKMIDVNLRAPLVLMHLALPHLAKTHGNVVNVASLAGHVPIPDSATYSSSKFGLRALTLALRQEWLERGVTFSLVSPGPVTTGFIMDNIDNVSDLTFSQPISSAEEVTDDILHCIEYGDAEICRPKKSGRLAKLAYVFPQLRTWLRPSLERKGRRTKDALRRQQGTSSGS